MNILEICPYEPPASGWVTRLKFIRRAIQQKGGTCEVLDIGPGRRQQKPMCIPVINGRDYIAKVLGFARQGFTIHSHINAEYFRGMLLALVAQAIGRSLSCRCIVTFHAGTDQLFFNGWKKIATAPFFSAIFSLAHSVICNSEAVRTVLSRYQTASKFFPVPAFSRQYLEYREVGLPTDLTLFLGTHSPIVSTYLCFREGFFTDVLIESIAPLVKQWPRIGLIIVGTGDDLQAFQKKVESLGLSEHVLTGYDLEHNEFMTLMSKSDVHLRTPVTDGVSSTVLEALSMRIPVVASDNGNRPASVVTYTADDHFDLHEKLDQTLRNRDRISADIVPPAVNDTVESEVNLIMHGTTSGSFGELQKHTRD